MAELRFPIHHMLLAQNRSSLVLIIYDVRASILEPECDSQIAGHLYAPVLCDESS